MNKTIEPVNFKADQSIINKINKQFDDLPNYHSEITSADIYLKKLKENPLYDNLVEIKVFLAGREVYAEGTGENIYAAANKAYDKVKRQLSETKKRDKDHRQPNIYKEG